MAPDSLGAELAAIATAVVAAIGLGLLWNRARGWRNVVLRVASVLICVLTASAGAAVGVNRQVDFLPSWSALTSNAPDAPDAPGDVGQIGEAAGAARSGKTHGGHVVSVVVTGAASRMTVPMYVYLPPGYDPNGPLRYPVIEAFHGYPGVPAQWLHSLGAPRILDKEIADGRWAQRSSCSPTSPPSRCFWTPSAPT